MNSRKSLVLLLLPFFIMACNSSSTQKNDDASLNVDLSRLKRYFGVQKIGYNYSSENFYLNVGKPQMKFHDNNNTVEQKVRDYSSIGALLFADIPKDILIDSLIMNFEVNSTAVRISYKYSDLILIKEDAKRGVDFLEMINENKYSEADSYLDELIFRKYGVTQVRKLYQTINTLGVFKKLEFIKFKIQKDRVSIFINAIYKEGQINTYVVMFSLHNSKILGVNTNAL